MLQKTVNFEMKPVNLNINGKSAKYKKKIGEFCGTEKICIYCKEMSIFKKKMRES